MTGIIVLLTAVFLHLAGCGLWIKYGKTPKNELLLLLPILVCLPGIGIICAWISSRPTGDAEETPVAKLYEKVEKDLMTVSTGRPELDTVVPFDEVLLLSNDRERREVMMHILRRDPFLYLEMLKTAKVSSDVEITHYATTTIMEIQRDLDIAMQEAQADYQNNPNNLESVNRFIDALSSYLDTGLLLENRMIQLRRQLTEVLEHKLVIFPNSRSAHHLLVENEITLGNFARAADAAASMRDKWPADELSWLKSLHVCMAAGDAKEKANITARMITLPIIWSRSGREEVEFVCGNIAGQEAING